MNTTEDFVLGMDIGGSHFTLGLVNMASKKIVQPSYYRSHINSWGSCGDIIEIWSNAIEKAYEKLDGKDKRIGIAMPGPFDYRNGISYIRGNNKYDALYGLNIKNLLAEKLNIEPANIRMLNDAAAFLQGEGFSGAAKNFNRLAGITLGTGLGSAVCIDGVAEDADLWNSPFKDSIAEEYISTRWFVKRYFELTGVNILDVKALSSIADQSHMAKSVFKEFSENLGTFIKSFVADKKAEVVILGGNITKAAPHFLSGLNKFLLQENVNVPIRISELGENAAILGAASCWQTIYK